MNEYIAQFPEEIQVRLHQIADLVLQIAPNASPCISYGIPTFKIGADTVVHFAAFKQHIGVYALPTTHKAFAEALAIYKTGKGSVQFPHKQDLPIDLIAQMIAFRLSSINYGTI